VRTGPASKSSKLGSLAMPPTTPATAPRSWQEAMRLAIRDARQLRELLHLPPEQSPDAAQAQQEFSTFVPLEFLSRIRPGDLRDPLLMQVLPIAAEAEDRPGFVADP